MGQLASSPDGKLKVCAVAGTRVVLLALHFEEPDTEGLQGFAFRRGIDGGAWSWLTGLKIFSALFPDGVRPREDGKIPRFTTNEHPIQRFLWSDYAAKADTRYQFEISAIFGKPGALEARYVTTETNAKRHKREMFFEDPAVAWSAEAAHNAAVFHGEKKPPVV